MTSLKHNCQNDENLQRYSIAIDMRQARCDKIIPSNPNEIYSPHPRTDALILFGRGKNCVPSAI